MDFPSDPVSIERAIDTLFGESPKGTIARTLCLKGALDRDAIAELRGSLPRSLSMRNILDMIRDVEDHLRMFFKEPKTAAKKEDVAYAIRKIEEVADRYGIDDAYFVGGYPRVLAMGASLADVHDLDVATGSNRAQELAGLVAAAEGSRPYKLHHRSMATTVLVGSMEVDFQGTSSHDDVRPVLRMWNVEDTALARNIFDRDFTINSLAIRLGSNQILDVTRRGIPDIHDKRIASILPPQDAVPENPLMITRAIRMAVRYDFKIDSNLWSAMKKNAEALKSLSPQRLYIEGTVLSKYDRAESMLQKLGISLEKLKEGISHG